MSVIIDGSTGVTTDAVGKSGNLLTLPATDGTNGQVLQTNGSGTLSFGDKTSVASPLTVTANSTAGAEIRLPEDTDNGSNYVALKAADSIASNLTLTLPNADGTSGQFLQTDGSGGLSFADAGGGAWNWISTTTASNSTTVDITSGLDSTYDHYVIIAENVAINTAQSYLFIRFYLGGTLNSSATSYEYCYSYINSNAVTNLRGGYDSFIRMTDDTYTSPVSSFILHIPRPSNTNSSKYVYGNAMSFNNGVNFGYYQFAGWQTTVAASTPLTGLQFRFNSGNVNTGTFRLYGISNS